MSAILIHGFGYNAAVFDGRFFEEAWPAISRGLESEADAEAEDRPLLDRFCTGRKPGGSFALDSPRIVLVATK